MSTRKQKCLWTSAPRIDFLTLVMRNIHGKVEREGAFLMRAYGSVVDSDESERIRGAVTVSGGWGDDTDFGTHVN